MHVAQAWTCFVEKQKVPVAELEATESFKNMTQTVQRLNYKYVLKLISDTIDYYIHHDEGNRDPNWIRGVPGPKDTITVKNILNHW